MSTVARCTDTIEDGRRVLRFAGDLTLARLGVLPTKLDRMKGRDFVLDLSGVGRMDTIGAWTIHRVVRDRGGTVVGASPGNESLLRQMAQVDQPVKVRPDPPPAFTRVLDQLGSATVEAGRTLLGLLAFFGAMLIGVARVFREPRRFRINAVVQRFEVVGVHAFGIIGLMSFLVGIVIAQQGAVQLRQFGAEVFTVNLIGRSSIKELGVLMTAIMVAGRSGSAFAAQLGSMKLAEEVDAMRTIGVSPMEALVLPRVFATVMMMPLLSFYAAIVAIVGGGIFCWIGLDIPPVTFVQRIREVVPVTDLWQLLVKAPVFGLIIALAGCFQGMQVEASAEEVGLRTTTAVVQGIFLVIVLDAFFAVFFTEVGWL
ncbi:MlaE family lipid ABC transporter permease subunit [Sphingomonas parva]|uniref:MlaE family lipid ABC transporter permease subunit n=1 Tax=Sphingomonas parva TaxID=2555898 RepID=A0A4Y8ZWT8_9SPHN|nr:MlaE family lipid ABC transporter permease subunit [Sphingomonas parva]TFI59842.1 MlaE family lipid ABC transporter permease subunit [Sphingomonas parva]